ncbi:unnamed protein product [Soboliphyme baturini]|uniref:Phospholipase A2 n=1 Tax=Soboliphyme baturini TaxID=241478 RepID=A0A183IEI0_9BILA|nr:unnamed protein product [Soboliphyme baturini]
MSTLLELVFFVILGVSVSARYRKRTTRSFWNFRGVVTCVTGNTASLYFNYGCYCGLGGSGNPVDEIDSCCQTHDLCYQALSQNRLWAYFTHYSYECVDGHARCGEENSDLAYTLCLCDVDAAYCFSQQKYPAWKPACEI